MGFVRTIVIFSVIIDVSSPNISLTDINVLSVILSNGNGFQFFIINEPVGGEKINFSILILQFKTAFKTHL